ncbi:hypothetical protein BDD14_2586 [Edaphobacter modestus]|uniref:Uncharacterized protein n=2 Tax=Edaphobacter modestus TaxID=388466 RepID=A0A4Q7YVC8_9BACT|nr:hypothetical protein BDD14_2586 [Edaphobacter modestus]
MRLIVDGLDSTIPRFRHLWGHHIVGFRPYTHCRRCFVGRDERNVRPTMADGEYELDGRGEIFYLCGVGFKERHNTNVHLAVRPQIGSIAAIGSAYGVRFTIRDAQAIPIKHPMFLESPPRGLEGLKENHLRCKNFQFGCQMFEVDEVGDTVKGVVVRTLRDGAPVRRCKL